MQNGTPMWEAAGYLGMCEKTLREIYGNHHSDFLKGASTAMGRRPQQLKQSLVISLAEERRSAQRLLKPLKTLVADAVVVEPVSTLQFPANREKSRDFFDSRPLFRTNLLPAFTQWFSGA